MNAPRAEVLSIGDWQTNAELIADVARLGYLEGEVFDATYGEGGFWTVFKPAALITNDLKKPADHNDDFRALPWSDGTFDVVVFDPDYKLEGSPSAGNAEMAYRYGVDTKKNRETRLGDIEAGARECFRVCRKRLLVKCMDMVEGGKMRWQTDIITRAIEELGGRKVDRFDFARLSASIINGKPVVMFGGRRQPPGRRQVTARHCASQLLVFEKPRLAREVE